ncbi:MAG: hypothetical protein R3C69_05220 [Geminicoccaceae bacterium]
MTAGKVMFGTVGDAERLEYTVLGEPVNLAAKLEKHAKVERTAAVVMAEAFDAGCRQGFRPRLQWALRPARTVDGVARAIDIRVC